MNLKNEQVTSDTHPLLVKMIHAYQPTTIPARQDLLEVNYQMPQTEGHCTLKGLCLQMGVKYEEEIEQRREIEMNKVINEETL